MWRALLEDMPANLDVIVGQGVVCSSTHPRTLSSRPIGSSPLGQSLAVGKWGKSAVLVAVRTHLRPCRGTPRRPLEAPFFLAASRTHGAAGCETRPLTLKLATDPRTNAVVRSRQRASLTSTFAKERPPRSVPIPVPASSPPPLRSVPHHNFAPSPPTSERTRANGAPHSRRHAVFAARRPAAGRDSHAEDPQPASLLHLTGSHRPAGMPWWSRRDQGPANGAPADREPFRPAADMTSTSPQAR